mmetsp:Transcript_22624/g.59092  ORF Transcript_22624/g.59092 Transcript_22624/m.59092 type:complete len:384 (-) Transcript_22624:2698-3849(-)
MHDLLHTQHVLRLLHPEQEMLRFLKQRLAVVLVTTSAHRHRRRLNRHRHHHHNRRCLVPVGLPRPFAERVTKAQIPEDFLLQKLLEEVIRKETEVAQKKASASQHMLHMGATSRILRSQSATAPRDDAGPASPPSAPSGKDSEDFDVDNGTGQTAPHHQAFEGRTIGDRDDPNLCCLCGKKDRRQEQLQQLKAQRGALQKVLDAKSAGKVKNRAQAPKRQLLEHLTVVTDNIAQLEGHMKTNRLCRAGWKEVVVHKTPATGKKRSRSGTAIETTKIIEEHDGKGLTPLEVIEGAVKLSRAAASGEYTSSPDSAYSKLTGKLERPHDVLLESATRIATRSWISFDMKPKQGTPFFSLTLGNCTVVPQKTIRGGTNRFRPTYAPA